MSICGSDVHPLPAGMAEIDAACFALGVFAPQPGQAEFRLINANPALERLAGVSGETLRGKTLDAVLGGEDVATLETTCNACVTTRRVQHCTHVVTPPSGRMLWRTALAPIIDDRGMVRTVLGSATLVAASTFEANPTLHGDILYYNALARMPLSKMLRVVQMRRMDPTPIDAASGRALEIIERLCLAAEEAVDATESAARAAAREKALAPMESQMWNALFEGMRHN